MRSPCCSDDTNLKKGPWTPEEDQKLIDFINIHGCGSWRALPKLAGLNRCGKSCRLRWTNYLRPDIKRGKFTDQEERIIIDLHAALGNKWSKIASHLPGRTDNEIKNFWNTHIRKKLLHMGIDPNTHKPRTDLNQLLNLSQIISAAQFGNLMNPWDNFALRLQTDATHLAKLQLLQNLLQIMNTNTLVPNIDSTSTLLGSQNLNPFQGLINKTYIKEPDLLQPSHDHSFLNQGLNSQAATANEQLQALADSWTCLENLDVGDNNTIIQPDKTLPPLISSASTDQTTTISQTKSKSNTVQLSTGSSPVSSNFEDWEKLLDIDETGDSYWKNMLQFTSTPSSPISW